MHNYVFAAFSNKNRFKWAHISLLSKGKGSVHFFVRRSLWWSVVVGYMQTKQLDSLVAGKSVLIFPGTSLVCQVGSINHEERQWLARRKRLREQQVNGTCTIGPQFGHSVLLDIHCH